MRRRKRTTSRLVGRYFALAALFVIALALLVQSLRPSRPAAEPAADDGAKAVAAQQPAKTQTFSGAQQMLYVCLGEAEVSCGSGAKGTTIGTGERVALPSGCTVSTGPGGEVALVFEHGKVLIVLGPNAQYEQGSVARRGLAHVLRVEGMLARGKASCWVDGRALNGASVQLETGPSVVSSSGGLFAAVAYDAEGARLAVYEGDVRVTVGGRATNIAPGQEVGLLRDSPITLLATAEEAPERPDLPADLLAEPAPTSTLGAATPGQSAMPTETETWELYTVQRDDTLSSIATAYGITWQELWEANRDTVPNPQVLLAGQTLRIPRKAAE